MSDEEPRPEDVVIDLDVQSASHGIEDSDEPDEDEQ